MACKCEVCGKIFTSPDFLIAHYKRRHLDYYMDQIRPKEDEMLKAEIRDIAKDLATKSSDAEQKKIITNIKSSVMEQLNSELFKVST